MNRVNPDVLAPTDAAWKHLYLTEADRYWEKHVSEVPLLNKIWGVFCYVIKYCTFLGSLFDPSLGKMDKKLNDFKEATREVVHILAGTDLTRGPIEAISRFWTHLQDRCAELGVDVGNPAAFNYIRAAKRNVDQEFRSLNISMSEKDFQRTWNNIFANNIGKNLLVRVTRSHFGELINKINYEAVKELSSHIAPLFQGIAYPSDTTVENISDQINLVVARLLEEVVQTQPDAIRKPDQLATGHLCFIDVDPTSIFSNAYPCKIRFKDDEYQNAEAAFKAQKYSLLDSKRIKKIKLFPHEVIMHILRAKFGKNPELKTQLLETGNTYLASQGYDLYWDDSWDGTGENRFGQCLMLLREEYGGTGVVLPSDSYKKMIQDMRTKCEICVAAVPLDCWTYILLQVDDRSFSRLLRINKLLLTVKTKESAVNNRIVIIKKSAEARNIAKMNRLAAEMRAEKRHVAERNRCAAQKSSSEFDEIIEKAKKLEHNCLAMAKKYQTMNRKKYRFLRAAETLHACITNAYHYYHRETAISKLQHCIDNTKEELPFLG